ncbi:hypothetical protein FT639_22670 [Bacillus mycoides]|nr:hypothetical protein [Bacillus mycoides]
MAKYYWDGSPIHIIKIEVVQVGERHLRVSFFLSIIPLLLYFRRNINEQETNHWHYRRNICYHCFHIYF